MWSERRVTGEHSSRAQPGTQRPTGEPCTRESPGTTPIPVRAHAPMGSSSWRPLQKIFGVLGLGTKIRAARDDRKRMSGKRDGRSLTDLALFCDEMQGHIRRLTKSLKAEATDREAARNKAHSSTIQRSMRSLSSALQELVSVMPRVPSMHPADEGLDSRVLAMGLITQWLDRDCAIAEKARRGIHGHSDTIELGSVVEIIAVQRKSGLLRVRGQTETILLEFDEGDVVHAVSDNAPICDRLGEILVEQGALERDVLKGLLSKYADSRQKLGTHHEIQKLVGEARLARCARGASPAALQPPLRDAGRVLRVHRGRGQAALAEGAPRGDVAPARERARARYDA